MFTAHLPNTPLPLPYGPPDPGSIRALLGLTQTAMAAAVGVTSNTWARWERGTLAIHPAYQLLLDLIEHKADRDADRVATRLQAQGGVRNLW
jgi:transcriptional regulator with XRE-family HTH domain